MTLIRLKKLFCQNTINLQFLSIKKLFSRLNLFTLTTTTTTTTTTTATATATAATATATATAAAAAAATATATAQYCKMMRSCK